MAGTSEDDGLGSLDPQTRGELTLVSEHEADWLHGTDEPSTVLAGQRPTGNGPRDLTELIESLQSATLTNGHTAEMGAEHELAAQAPVVRLVDMLVSDAIAARASDIHLETAPDRLRIRYRIDGLLQDGPSPPPHIADPTVSRLKVMAELDIAEKRVPMDGRMRFQDDVHDVDIRMSVLPSLHGESVVLRLLHTNAELLPTTDLGLSEDDQKKLLGTLSRPQGVVLVTGPTGSGKTTTLYSLIDRLQGGCEKIVAVEDPVEYDLPGVVQLSVRPDLGLTFGRALRSILRQDPDVLLVGEMRDPETAEICIQAALTGHLVLSTLHTNDAPSALTRLLDLGIPDYLVASTVDVVVAQRLIRRTCSGCAVLREVAEALKHQMAADGCEIATASRGLGCAECLSTGYRGRTGIYEVLIVDDRIRAEVMRRRGSGPLRTLAIENGMRPLRVDGWRQVAAGVTTPEEVLRVTVA